MPQSLSSILLHLIFSTKQREPLITPAVEPELHAYLIAIFRDLECPSLQINGTSNHIHTLFRLSRTATVCHVVERCKKDSSRWIKTKGAEFQNFAWQQGYGIFSVSESNAEKVKQYIHEQKEHHKIRSFQEEYRAFLRKYRIQFDERYLWD